MNYIYNGTIKCKEKDVEAVKSYVKQYLFTHPESIGDGEISIDDEERGAIVGEMEDFCTLLREQNIFINGQISFCGDDSGKFVIEDSEVQVLSIEECVLLDSETETLIEELNRRGYSVYKVPTEPEEEPEDGQETFCVSMKVDGRVDVYVNAPKGDFEAAKKAAEIEFSSSGDYDCGVVENIDSFPVNATDSEGDMVDF